MPALKNRIERLERAFPETRPRTKDDRDALTLYRGVSRLHGYMTPSFRELEGTAAYARGRDLTDQAEEQVEHGEPKAESRAASCFEKVFNRPPESGDILWFWQLRAVGITSEHFLLNKFIEAWGRQIKDMPCPLRVEGDKVLARTKAPKVDAPIEWEEYEDSDITWLKHEWRDIEQECGVAGELKDGPLSDFVPIVPGVVFLDAGNCRPATQQELEGRQDESIRNIGNYRNKDCAGYRKRG
jgi:hypothetical protein